MQFQFDRKQILKNVTLTLFFAVIFIAIFYFVRMPKGKAQVSIYGTSYDQSTADILNNFLVIKDKLGNKINLKIHLAAREKNNDLSSFMEDLTNSQISDQLNIDALKKLDLEENKRQLVIQKYWPEKYFEYLKTFFPYRLNSSWQSFAIFAGLDIQKIEEKVKAEGDDLLKSESNRLKNLEEKISSKSLPVIIINGKLYEGKTDLFSLSAVCIQKILRNKKESLPKPKILSLFNNSININLSRYYYVVGINECFNDLDCNDNPEKNGVCQNPGTVYTRCVYSEPEKVIAYIFNDKNCQLCDTSEIEKALSKDFKKIFFERIDIASEAGQKLKNEISANSLPLIFFESSIEKAKNFQAYKDQNYLSEVQLVSINQNKSYQLINAALIPAELFKREEKENILDVFLDDSCSKTEFVKKAVDNFVSQKEKDGVKLIVNIHKKDNALTKELNVDVFPTFLWKNKFIAISLGGLKKISIFNDLETEEEALGLCPESQPKSS